MFFNRDQVEHLPNHGEVISAHDFLEKVNEMIESKLIFEADYIERDVIHKETAEEFLIELYQLLKDK